MTRVTFYGSRKIHYISYEINVLLSLVCSNTQVTNTVQIIQAVYSSSPL